MKIKFSLTLRHCVLNVFKYELTRMHFNVLDPDVATGGSQEWNQTGTTGPSFIDTTCLDSFKKARGISSSGVGLYIQEKLGKNWVKLN